jgi:hypothetical protein
MLGRQALAVALVGLIACPVWAGPESVGTVARSQEASLRGTSAIPGSTIFDGDMISVGPHGTVSLALAGGSQVQLSANSQARFTRQERAFELQLDRGRVLFRSSAQAQLQGLLGDATFRPATGGPAVGIIAFQDSNTAFLYAEQGDWVLTTEHDGKMLMVPQGEGLEARLEPASAASAAPQEPPRARKRRAGGWVTFVVGALLIGGATAAAIAALNGESHLSPLTRSNAISPFQFQ